MKIIKPSATLLWITTNAEKIIEKAGRTCYKSENLITEDSSDKFIQSIVKRNHHSVLEHASASFRLICDRGVMAELTRHRSGISFSIESTRYCNYSQDKFNNELTVIEPCFWIDNPLIRLQWENTIFFIEQAYNKMIELGATAEEARSILPNSLKTEIVVTANFREWLHIIKLRTSKQAHPQIVETMNLVKEILKKECPNVFSEV